MYHAVLKKHMMFHVRRGRMNFSLPQNDAKYAERLGLGLARKGKRGKRKLGGKSVTVIRSHAKKARGKELR